MGDFEKYWLSKLRRNIEEVTDTEFAEEIMEGSQQLSDQSETREVISWTAEMVEKLKEQLSRQEVNEIITRCACNYPPADLASIRDAFRVNHSFTEAMEMLRDQFRKNLTERLQIEPEIVEKLLQDGMGSAGILEDERIVATKIPKSGNLREWLAEDNPEKKRQLYCHCPRIRDAVTFQEAFPVEYCLCGAGFYRDIWEKITEDSVHVEVLESILAGDDLCRIAIYPSALKG